MTLLLLSLGLAVVAMASGRDERGRVGPGNQIARKYPKPPTPDDPAIQQQLAQESELIISDRGGRDRLSTIMLSAIDRLVVLGLFLQSWEQLFLRSGFTTRKGRVRSGYGAGYLATLDRYMRLAKEIGVSREAHAIQSPREWLESLRANDQQPEEEEGQDDDESPDAHDHEQPEQPGPANTQTAKIDR